MNSFVRLRKEPSLQAKGTESLVRSRGAQQKYLTCTHSLSVNTDAELHMSIAPELASLRRKMMKTALECGVSEISNESVRYMMLSLEVCLVVVCHLEILSSDHQLLVPFERHLGTCKEERAPNHTHQHCSHYDNVYWFKQHQQHRTNKPNAITAPELHTSIEIAPYLFGDHSPLNKGNQSPTKPLLYINQKQLKYITKYRESVCVV